MDKVKLGNYWHVDSSGNISNTSKNTQGYSVYENQLTQINWFENMLNDKGIVSSDILLEFYMAYIQALKNAKYKKVIINLSNRYTIQVD